jgi:amyotrophic lateral sclerosis 2 protein
MKFSGMVYKNQTPASPSTGGAPLHLDIKHFTVEPHLKWTCLFRKFRSLLNLGETSHQLEAWQQLAILINQNKVQAREYETTGKPIEGLDQVEMIPCVGMSGALDWHQYSGIVKYLSATAQCRIHPLYQLLHQLIDSFTASYGGVRSHPTLLPLAKDELDSIVYRLYNIIMELFPSLPSPDKHTWLENPEKEGEGEMVTPNSVLHPLLLPPLHPTVFMLYALKEQNMDREYWHRILRWNRHTDVSLLTFLEVDTRFWEKKQSSDHRGRDLHFLAAIETLQRLKTTFTPQSKLNVIVSVFKDITRLVTDGHLVWSMDSLLPVCMYVVVRARVLQLGAELAMLADLMETHLFQGEQGIMFTTLQAAYLQILKESIFIN